MDLIHLKEVKVDFLEPCLRSDLLEEFLNLIEGKSRFRPLVELVKAGFNIHNVYRGNTTALHIACTYGNIQVVRELLEIGGTEDILRADAEGDTPIHVAAQYSSLEVIKALFENLGDAAEHYSVRNNENGQTPLHWAMGNKVDSVGTVRYLIHHGADVHARNKLGNTPLHYAARFGKVAALQLLLDKAENLDVDEENGKGRTALHNAASYGRLAAAEWLLNHGADLNRKDAEGSLPLHRAATGFDEDGSRTQLVKLLLTRQDVEKMLVENGQRQNVLQLLEEAGHTKVILPSLNVMVEKGVLQLGFPKFVLVRYIVQYGGRDLNSKLMEHLAKIWRTEVVDLFKERDVKSNHTLLEWAAIKGDFPMKFIDMVEKYLDRELELQLESAFRLSLIHRNLRFTKMLVQRLKYKDKITEWIKAERMKKDLITKEAAKLQRSGLPKEIPEGQLPLAFYIFYLKRFEIAKFIKDDNLWEDIINETDPRKKRTALHWATIIGSKKIVTQLCKISDCRGTVVDGDGKMAYEYAMGQSHIQKELSEKQDIRSYLEILYRDRQVFVDASNAMLVGAALIASITFSGFLQPPAFRDSKEFGKGLQVFLACNSLSFFFAMATVLAGAKGVLPKPNIFIRQVVNSIRHTLVVTSTLLVLSVTFSLGAFAAAGFSLLPGRRTYKKSMISTVVIGASICTPIVVWFAKGILAIPSPSSEGDRLSGNLGQNQDSDGKEKVPDEGMKSDKGMK